MSLILGKPVTTWQRLIVWINWFIYLRIRSESENLHGQSWDKKGLSLIVSIRYEWRDLSNYTHSPRQATTGHVVFSYDLMRWQASGFIKRRNAQKYFGFFSKKNIYNAVLHVSFITYECYIKVRIKLGNKQINQFFETNFLKSILKRFLMYIIAIQHLSESWSIIVLSFNFYRKSFSELQFLYKTTRLIQFVRNFPQRYLMCAWFLQEEEKYNM